MVAPLRRFVAGLVAGVPRGRTVLTLINQGDHLFAGDVDVVTAAQVMANYAIPYVVAVSDF